MSWPPKVPADPSCPAAAAAGVKGAVGGTVGAGPLMGMVGTPLPLIHHRR